MRKLLLVTLAGAGALAMAGQAAAYVMVARVAGTVGTVVSSGTAFDPSGASIGGDPFTAVFTFNSDVAGVVTTPTSVEAAGGICCLTDDPILGAALTINGVTRSMGGFNGRIRYDAATGAVLFQAGRNDAIDSNLTIQMSGSSVPLSLETSFSLSQDVGSVFHWTEPTLVTDRAWLIPTSLVVTAASVPEPATWAMMILGFFGLGAALRRERTAPSI